MQLNTKQSSTQKSKTEKSITDRSSTDSIPLMLGMVIWPGGSPMFL